MFLNPKSDGKLFDANLRITTNSEIPFATISAIRVKILFAYLVYFAVKLGIPC